MIRTTIDTEKIREVIGEGGSVIQKITAETGTKIDIEEDGSIFISSTDIEACRRALKIINGIVRDPQIGDVFYGKVTRIMTFGAFVEFAPGKEGMIHISKLENHRVSKVEDVLNIGDGPGSRSPRSMRRAVSTSPARTLRKRKRNNKVIRGGGRISRLFLSYNRRKQDGTLGCIPARRHSYRPNHTKRRRAAARHV